MLSLVLVVNNLKYITTLHYGLEAPKKGEKSNPFEVLFF
jgi:hypothetical protein